MKDPQAYIRDLEERLRAEWREHLEPLGVKFPTGSKLMELLCLYEHMPEALSQDRMEAWLDGFEFEYKRQARHLADAGWDIRSGNSRFTRGMQDSSLGRSELRLHTVKDSNPIWSKNDKKRTGYLNAETWGQILQQFKERGCAVCGRKFSTYDQGHLRKDRGYERGNIVPMCTECNNWGQEIEFKLDRGLVARPERHCL